MARIVEVLNKEDDAQYSADSSYSAADSGYTTDASSAASWGSDADRDDGPLVEEAPGGAACQGGASPDANADARRAAAVSAQRRIAADVMGGAPIFTAAETVDMLHFEPPPCADPLQRAADVHGWLGTQMDRLAAFVCKFNDSAVNLHVAAVLFLHGPRQLDALFTQYNLDVRNTCNAETPLPLHAATTWQLLQWFDVEARRQVEVGEAFTFEVRIAKAALHLLASSAPEETLPLPKSSLLSQVRVRIELLQLLERWMNWELPPLNIASFAARRQQTLLRRFANLPPMVSFAQTCAAMRWNIATSNDDANVTNDDMRSGDGSPTPRPTSA